RPKKKPNDGPRPEQNRSVAEHLIPIARNRQMGHTGANAVNRNNSAAKSGKKRFIDLGEFPRSFRGQFRSSHSLTEKTRGVCRRLRALNERLRRRRQLALRARICFGCFLLSQPCW